VPSARRRGVVPDQDVAVVDIHPEADLAAVSPLARYGAAA